MGALHVVRAQAEFRGALATLRENTARLAVSQHSYLTLGTGDVVPPKPIMFSVVFVHQPTFTSGLALTQVPDAAYLARWSLPEATVGIWRWVRDEHERWVGAQVFFGIRQGVKQGSVEPRPRLTHFLSFQGVAMKALDVSLGVDIAPREVGV